MHRRIQKLIGVLTFVAVSTIGLNFFYSNGAYADTLKQNVSCADGSTNIKTTTNKDHSISVSCSSGAKIYYITDDDQDNNQPVGVSITCSKGESVGSSVKNANAANTTIGFYCETPVGHDGDGLTTYKHTTNAPTLKQTAATGTVLCGDHTTAAPNNDVQQCPSSAAGNGDCSKGVQSCNLVSQYLKPFIRFLSLLVGLAVVFSIIVGGIQYGSSAGDPQKVTAAKNRIRNAILALVTYIFLFAMLSFLLPGGLV